MKRFLIAAFIFVSLILYNVTYAFEANDSQVELITKLNIESVSQDIKAKELFSLTSEIAEWANDYVGKEAFTAENISFDKAYKVYSNLLTGICESPESADELLETEDYSWFVYLEYEDYWLVVGIHMGNGVNMDGPLGEIVRGERDGSEAELDVIESLKEKEGHYYISSVGGAEKVVYEDVIAAAKNEGAEGNLCFSGAVAFSPAGILINGDDISVKYYDINIVKEKGLDVPDKFVPLEDVAKFQLGIDAVEPQMNKDGETYMGDAGISEQREFPAYFYVAIAVAIFSLTGLVTLFATRKKKVSE